MKETSTGGKGTAMAKPLTKAEKIKALNDQFRKEHKDKHVYLSLEVVKIGETMIAELFNKLKTYSSFTAKSDPDGDHSAGLLEVGRYKCEWIIDYWDIDEEDDSPDPSNAAVTTRIMNVIMV